MTPHCESECSAKTKLSTGNSSPALATRTALRERKDMAFTTPPYTGEGRQEDRVEGRGRGQDGDNGEEINDTEAREREGEKRKRGAEWLAAAGG